MGLESVELVIEVENTFGITIPDESATKIVTVGDLNELILRKLEENRPETSQCLSAVAFYQFRKALLVRHPNKLCRSHIRPEARMDDLIPDRHRRQGWEELGQALKWELPRLVRPTWAVLTLIAMGVIGMVLALWMRSPFVAIATGLALSALSYLTLPLATHFAAGREIVRAMVQKILELNFDRISSEWRGRNRQEVWETLRMMVAEVAGVSPERVAESARFVGDLGMG
jgi:hypothetical protein